MYPVRILTYEIEYCLEAESLIQSKYSKKRSLFQIEILGNKFKKMFRRYNAIVAYIESITYNIIMPGTTIR
jgi:hypothetical protein